jgi:hypothetical protein
MPTVYDIVRRLEAEPSLDDLARGFAAEIADPAWFLGRQWQLGEHQGEDASSPVRVRYDVRLTPVQPLDGADPRTTPAEAIVESEPADFWTAGRRVAAGRLVEDAAAAAGSPLPDDPNLRLKELPTPYDRLDDSGYDGQTLWERTADLGLDPAWFGTVRPQSPPPTDLWNPAELSYDADLQAGGVTLQVRRHDGGTLDWYSADAAGGFTPAPAQTRSVHPGRVRYPGAPLPRWWQIEDAKVDLGGYPPDRSHFATLLLLDLVMNQSDDWFSFPLDALAGTVVTLSDVTVTDSFGDDWTLSPPADGWSLFATAGLTRDALVVWATAAAPLTGPVLDDVTIGIDEDANLAWAVERRIHGRDVPTPDEPAPHPPQAVDATGRPDFVYRVGTRIPPRWHPYVIDEVAGRRRFVQGRAANLSAPSPVLLPEPSTDLLLAAPTHPIHQIEPAAVPSDGVRLERRAVLARRTDGTPLLWTQRRRLPLLTPPALRLRFDTLEPRPPTP